MADVRTQAATDVPGAAAALAGHVRAGDLKLSDAIDIAWDEIDAGGGVRFAEAVLLAAEELWDAKLPGMDNEFLRMRVGGLAHISAADAYKQADYKTADRLVFAAHEVWDRENYRRRNVGHDILIAYLWAGKGEFQRALTRLRARVDDDPAVLDAIREIQQAQRRGG
ncbi:MAG: hypothetical protein KAS72_03755 [Phycisphaerales bacterium]|nr:hypothetical protein [Phycisphaerales bacterium]